MTISLLIFSELFAGKVLEKIVCACILNYTFQRERPLAAEETEHVTERVHTWHKDLTSALHWLDVNMYTSSNSITVKLHSIYAVDKHINHPVA